MLPCSRFSTKRKDDVSELTGLANLIAPSISVLAQAIVPLSTTLARGVMPITEALRVLVSRKKRPLPVMIFDMVDMRGDHRATFQAAPSAGWLLGKPMPLDRFPDWRLVPSLPLGPGLDTAMPIPIDHKVGAVDWHGRRLRSTRSKPITGRSSKHQCRARLFSRVRTLADSGPMVAIHGLREQAKSLRPTPQRFKTRVDREACGSLNGCLQGSSSTYW